MKYFKMVIIIGLMVTAIISDDEQIDKICIIGLTAFALSNVIGELPEGHCHDHDECDDC